MLSPLAKADGERRKGISSSSFLKEEPKLPELLIAPLSAARERQGEREREESKGGRVFSSDRTKKGKMGFGAKGMSSVAFNQFWKERVEKEEAEIVNGSEKAMKNETVVVQGPLGVSMVRTYAQHR